MKDKISVYKTWAPDGALWTQWAKPVLFSGMLYFGEGTFSATHIKWIERSERDTMLILDLPDAYGVKEALGLAQKGFRPVPLYNGVKGPASSLALIDVAPLEKALFFGADFLPSCKLRDDAPPAFMLDSRRFFDRKLLGKYNYPGAYDNRWYAFPQDFPSAAFLTGQGIKKIILRSDTLRDDLAYVLYNYAKQGIMIYSCGEDDVTKALTVGRPHAFKRFFYRLSVTLKLRRNSTGGFGGIIPESEGGHG